MEIAIINKLERDSDSNTDSALELQSMFNAVHDSDIITAYPLHCIGWQMQRSIVNRMINSILFIVQHNFTLCYCKFVCHATNFSITNNKRIVD